MTPALRYILTAANYPAFLTVTWTPAPAGLRRNHPQGTPGSSPVRPQQGQISIETELAHGPLLGKPPRMHPADLGSCIAPSTFGGPSATKSSQLSVLLCRRSSAQGKRLSSLNFDPPSLAWCPQWYKAQRAEGRGRREKQLPQRPRSVPRLASIRGGSRTSGLKGCWAMGHCHRSPRLSATTAVTGGKALLLS